MQTQQIPLPQDLIPPGTDQRAAALAALLYRTTYRAQMQALIDTGLVIVVQPGQAPPPAAAPPPAQAPPPRPSIDPAQLQALVQRTAAGGAVGEAAKQAAFDQLLPTLPPEQQAVIQQALAAKQAGRDPLAAVAGSFQGEQAQIVQQLLQTRAANVDPVSQALSSLGVPTFTPAPRTT